MLIGTNAVHSPRGQEWHGAARGMAPDLTGLQSLCKKAGETLAKAVSGADRITRKYCCSLCIPVPGYAFERTGCRWQSCCGQNTKTPEGAGHCLLMASRWDCDAGYRSAAHHIRLYLSGPAGNLLVQIIDTFKNIEPGYRP